MSDNAKVPHACRFDRLLPPGSAVALASLMGLSGYVSAACVLIASGSWLWTLLTWLLASPIALAGIIAVQASRRHWARRACLDGRCRFHGPVHPIVGIVND